MDLWTILSATLGILIAVGAFALCLHKPRTGLLLSPLLSIAAGMAIAVIPEITLGMGHDDEEMFRVLGVVLGIVAVVLCLVAAAVSPVRGPNGGKAFARGVWAVLAILFVTAFGLALLTGLAGPAGFLLGLVLFAVIFRYILIARDTVSTHLFSTLGAALRQNLPLATTLETEAEAVHGRTHLMFRRVAGWLEAGLPLSEALRSGYPQCPGYALGLVTSAEKIHQLPQAVEAIVYQFQQQQRDRHRLQPVNPMYPFLVLFVAFWLLVFVSYFIIPSFEKIFDDMGEKLPALTRWVVAAFPPLMVLGAIVTFLLVIIWFYALFRPRDPRDPKLLSRLGDFLKWRLPAWRWFEKNYALLQTVGMIRMGLHAGTTVDMAIALAADLDVNLAYRRKLRDWLARVQRGESISDAAVASGAGRSLQWAFDPKANPSLAPAALEMLESSYKAAYSYRANLARYFFWPGITIAMATLVGTIVLAMFLPLIGLLRATMGEVLP